MIFVGTAETFRLVQMIEIRVVCCEEFLNWSNEMSCLLHEYPNVCRPFVVATEETYRFRGLWNPSYLLINFWTDAENFQEVFCSGFYNCIYHFVPISINHIAVIKCRFESFLFRLIYVRIIIIIIILHKFVRVSVQSIN